MSSSPVATGDRCGLEIPFVDRDVAALGGPVAGESASTGGVVARAQELHRVGNDIDCLAFGAVLGLPLAPLEPPVDRDRASLGEVARGVLALRAPHRDVEVVGLVLPLAGAPVLAARVAGDAQLHTEVPLGSERSSGSAVRFPVSTTLLMLVAATAPLPFSLFGALGPGGPGRDAHVCSGSAFESRAASGTTLARPGRGPR